MGSFQWKKGVIAEATKMDNPETFVHDTLPQPLLMSSAGRQQSAIEDWSYEFRSVRLSARESLTWMLQRPSAFLLSARLRMDNYQQ